MALARAVLTDLHWLREIARFQDGLPALVCEFQARESRCDGTRETRRARLVASAVAAQDLRVLAVLSRLAAQPQYASDIRFDGALALAASQGRLEALQWLLRQPTIVDACESRKLLDAVVGGSGDVATAAWLVAHGSEGSRSLSPVALAKAASSGSLVIIEWLHTSRRFDPAFQPSTMDSAATGGQIDVATFLHDHRTEGCTPQAAVQAAQHGHLAVLHLLFQWYPHVFGSTPAILDAAAMATTRDRLTMVQFLHETAQAPCTVAAIDNAAVLGDLEVVGYLLERRREGFSIKALTSAARAGHVEMVQVLIQRLERDKDSSMDLTRAITAAAQPGHLVIIRLLLKASEGRPQRNVSGAIRVAAAWGHAEIVRLLVAEGEWISLLDAVSQASYHGHQEIVELLKHANRARQSQARAY